MSNHYSDPSSDPKATRVDIFAALTGFIDTRLTKFVGVDDVWRVRNAIVMDFIAVSAIRMVGAQPDIDGMCETAELWASDPGFRKAWAKHPANRGRP